jgi:hypothetical protein
VPQSPQRPFVPHHTPTKPRPRLEIPEFRLSKPFVAGATRAEAEPGAPPIEEAVPSREERLPRIEEFLQIETPPVQSISAYTDDSFSSDFEEPDELPPVEHFLDPLPPVDHFTDEEFPSSYRTATPTSNSTPETQASGDESEWLETGWQNYDWRAAAALGETAGTEASNAWAETDWDAAAPRRNTPPTPAQAIATALDQIAQRIRDGELVVPSPTGMTDPAALAATVAALLGIRK